MSYQAGAHPSNTKQVRFADVKCGCRDVFNEKPTTEDMLASGAAGVAEGQGGPLPRTAVIHSTRGDIHVKLFPDQCPKTVENWTTHSRNGYYDGVIFHRVIKGFMLQTGDPLGELCTSLTLCTYLQAAILLTLAQALHATLVSCTLFSCCFKCGACCLRSATTHKSN